MPFDAMNSFLTSDEVDDSLALQHVYNGSELHRKTMQIFEEISR